MQRALVLLIAALAMLVTLSPSSATATLIFDGDFDTGLLPWTSTGGSAQCANYGTPSINGRLRGDFYLDTNIVGQGTASGRFYLPTDSNPTTYPLEQCSVIVGKQPLLLGTNDYYGLMVYVPGDFTIANTSFYGVEIHQYHFQGIWGSPIEFQLHRDHVTLALETGACYPSTSAMPGCRYRSNADNTWCRTTATATCLPGDYVIPPGHLVRGAWNEIMMHVHWASDATGNIQTWYRPKGSSIWTRSSNVTGIPTVQWDVTKGCCYGNYNDIADAYASALSAPVTLWLDDDLRGTSLSTVSVLMP